MALTEQSTATAQVSFETFYRPGMTNDFVEARAEPDSGQIGLLPRYEEATFLADGFWNNPAYTAASSIAEFYATSHHKIAHIGRLGVRLTEHEAPVRYVVLALEEPASYRGANRTPGIVRCVIDVLEGQEQGRYFEKHPFEKPQPILDEGVTPPHRKVDVKVFSPSDFTFLKRVGELADTARSHVQALQRDTK